MSKLQTWENVQAQVAELIGETKGLTKTFEAQLWEILRNNLEPKNGGGGMQNPPKEIDGVMHYYCRFHESYEPEQDMVISKGKSKGYCKASISKWNKQNALIKKLESKVVELMGEGETEKAETEARNVKELKATLNEPSNYNLITDWEVFRG